MKPEGVAVLNADDISFEGLAQCASCRCVTYGIEKDADYRAEDLDLYIGGTSFTLVHQGRRYPVRTNLCAGYNIYNLLGAVAAMHQMGMAIEDMLPLPYTYFSGGWQNGAYRQRTGFHRDCRLRPYAGRLCKIL